MTVWLRFSCRGLDPLGHVVFFHVPLFKVQRLLAAPLPRLRGQHLMTPTQVLRLALLSQHATNGGQAKSGQAKAGGRAVKGQGEGWSGVLRAEAEAITAAIITQPFYAVSSARVASHDSIEGPHPTAGAGVGSGTGGSSGCEQRARLPDGVSNAPVHALQALLQTQTQGLSAAAQERLLHTFSLSARHLMDCHLMSR